jgi:hypothetical protein
LAAAIGFEDARASQSRSVPRAFSHPPSAPKETTLGKSDRHPPPAAKSHRSLFVTELCRPPVRPATSAPCRRARTRSAAVRSRVIPPRPRASGPPLPLPSPALASRATGDTPWAATTFGVERTAALRNQTS